MPTATGLPWPRLAHIVIAEGGREGFLPGGVGTYGKGWLARGHRTHAIEAAKPAADGDPGCVTSNSIREAPPFVLDLAIGTIACGLLGIKHGLSEPGDQLPSSAVVPRE